MKTIAIKTKMDVIVPDAEFISSLINCRMLLQDVLTDSGLSCDKEVKLICVHNFLCEIMSTLSKTTPFESRYEVKLCEDEPY